MSAPLKVSEDVEAAQNSVSRSWPSLTRPRLSTASENRLAEVERRSAACYAGMEALTKKLDNVRRDIESEPESTNGVPSPVEAWEDDSLVQSIDEFRAATAAAKP